ncbi:MAG: cation-translocating P-type ATPase C-terminal domain-containing protein [Chitinophagales bacterium]
MALGFPAPLIAIQILWLNLVTDSLPAIALANEKGQDDILENDASLQNRNHILNIEVLPLLTINVLVMSILSLLTFQYYLDQSLDLARTAVFVVMSSTQLFNVFNLRSIHKSVFRIGMFSNRYVNVAVLVSIGFTMVISQVPFWAKIFRFEPLDWSHFTVLVFASSIVLIIGEIYKLARTRIQKIRK